MFLQDSLPVNIVCGLRIADCSDFCPHHSPVYSIKPQHRQCAVITGFHQIAVQEPPGKSRVSGMLKIHEKKSEITDHIDYAERIIELYTVKNKNPVLPPDHIAGMHVAVALPYKTPSLSLQKKRIEPLVLL